MHINENFIKKFLKFDDKAKNILELSEKELSLIEFYKIIYKSKNKPIKDSVIDLFYDNPENFFKQHKTFLEKTSFFDSMGNSIFQHYFYILLENYNLNNEKNYPNKIFTNEKIQIYEKNFSSFFKEHKQYLLIQDINLDTPLHKIARLNDKRFFVSICKKLNELKILSEELLMTINDKGENICQYIFDEIKKNYIILLTEDKNKSNYESLSCFVKMVKDSFPKIFSDLTKDLKIILLDFIENVKFHIIKEKDFNNLYKEINMLFKKKKNICTKIFYQFPIEINFLNYLYEICKLKEDYENLLNLVYDITSKPEIQNKVCISDICIVNHMIYVFRKMNSLKVKGNMQIEYCILLMKKILPKLIEEKNSKYIIKILNYGNYYNKKKRFKNGLIGNIRINPNLTFEKKFELFNILNEVTSGLLEQEIGEDFSVYFFYKLIINKQISELNVIRLYSKDIDFKNIINEQNIITNLYEYIYSLCIIYEKRSIKSYINLLNDFILKSNPKTLCNYKEKYNMTDKSIKQILDIVFLFVKRAYENQFKYKQEGVNLNLDYIEQEKIRFLLTNENLSKYSILDIFKKNKSDFLALKLIFSFKYDFSEFIDSNKSQIIKLINKFKEKFTQYLYSFKFQNNNIEIERKLTTKLSELLTNDNINLEYNLSKKVNKINFQKLCSVCWNKDSYNKFISRMRCLTSKYLKYLLFNWNQPLDDYSEIINEIKDDIPCYCQYFLKTIISKEYKVKTINFFFNDFIYLLNPELKSNYEYNRIFSFKYMSSIKNIDKEQNWSIPKFQRKTFNQNSHNSFYFLMMLINIKIKYGDYNPNLLYYICNKYFSFNDAFFYFVDNLEENAHKNERVKHFFLHKKINNNSGMHLEIKNYISKNISTIKYMKYSLFIKFFVEMRENYFYWIVPNLHIINISYNIEKIYNILIEDIINRKLYYYDFLSEDPKNLEENLIYSKIDLLKSLSQYINSRLIKEQGDSEYYYSFDICFAQINKYNIFINIYKFLKVLKNSNIPLIDCFCNNFFLISDTISLFLYVFYYIIESYEPIKKMDLEINFILNEAYLFLNSFYIFISNNEQLKNYQIDNFHLFFQLIVKIFCNRINSLNDKNNIYKEYNLFIELIKFIYKKNDSENSLNNEINFYSFNEQTTHIYSNSFLINKTITHVLKKIPEKFIDICEFFFNTFNNLNVFFQGNILINKYSENILSNLYRIYSITKCNQQYDNQFNLHLKNENLAKIKKATFLENSKTYLIKNILKFLNNYNDLNGVLTEEEIFKNKKFSLSLLNNKYNYNITKYLINQIYRLYFNNNYEDLLIEILNNNINNYEVIDLIFNSFSEAKIREFFLKNKGIIFKSIYFYSQINQYKIIQKLLKYSDNYFGHQFIQNILFPPNIIKDYMELYLNIKKGKYTSYKSFNSLFLRYDIDINLENEDNLETLEEELIFKKINDENVNFSFNNTIKTNFSSNFESREILFQYATNKESFFLAFIYSNLYSNLGFVDQQNLKTMIEILIKWDKFSENKSLDSNNNVYKIIYNNKSYSLTNPFYIKIYKLIELIKIKVPLYLNKSSSNEKIILKNFINIFVLKKVPNILNNIYENDFRYLKEIEVFIILALFEIKGCSIISIKEFFPKFYQNIKNEFIKIKNELKPEMDLINSENEINECILNFKNIINNNIDSFIKELKKNTNFYSFIFILEKKSNIICKIEDDDEYLEKILLNLNLQLESQETDSIAYYLISLKDFNSISISIIDKCLRKRKKIYKNNYFIFEDYTKYLLKISSIINFVLKKIYKNEIYDINIFHSSTFYKDTQNSYIKMLKNIDIQKIKNHILEHLSKLDLEGKEICNFYIKKWLDYFINSKDIIEEMDALSKEPIAFIKFFKLLKINCSILINFLKIIKDMNIMLYNHSKLKIKINFICNEEENVEIAYTNLSCSLINFLRDFKLPLVFSFVFDDEQKDFVETVSKINLNFFIIYKLSSIDNFISELIKKQNKEDIIKFYPKQSNKENLNFILNLFFPLCKFPIIKYYYDNGFLKINLSQRNKKLVYNIPEKELPCYSNAINLYITKNLYDILMPNYEDFVSFLYYNIKCTFYNYLYPIINYNYNLKCVDLNIKWSSLFPFKNTSKSKNQIKKVEYLNFVDYSELIQAINSIKFFEDENINFYIQIKALNYIINDNSTIRKLIDELYNLASYESKANYIIRNLRIKIKILDNSKNENRKKFKIINPFYTEKLKPDIYTKVSINSLSNFWNYSNVFDSLFTIKDVKYEQVFEKKKDQYYYLFVIKIKQNNISQILKGFVDDELLENDYFYVEREFPKFINEKFSDLNSFFHIFRNENK